MKDARAFPGALHTTIWAHVAVIFLTFAIVGCGGAAAPSDTKSAAKNQAPTANAGDDMSAGEQRTVTLSGTGSDPDGDPISFSWIQISGTPVALSDAGTPNASFVAPSTAVGSALLFQLTVTDTSGLSTSDSIVVQITADSPPTANAGSNRTVDERKLVLLDGSTSTDPDGAIASYSWVQVSGLPVRLDYSDTAQPRFSAPNVNATSTLAFDLTVTDDIGDTDTDRVTITVRPAAVPPVPGDGGQFLSFLNLTSLPYQETQASADAYYAAIDPTDAKTTLDAWKSANGFDDGNDAHAVYRNGADLGFSRVMSLRTNPDGSVASYVENYATLDEAVAAEETGIRDGLLATVAMEYSAPPGDPNGAKYVKFYTYDGNDDRVTAVDLDGRGAKFQPGLCLVCHGGTPKALDNGVYPDNGDVDAQFLPWDVHTFDFANNSSFTRAAQEDQFKAFNIGALSTYPDPNATTAGRWSGNSSGGLIEGWYGDAGTTLPAATFDENFVPVGWRRPDNGGPAGNPPDVEELYLKAIGPNCRACHIQRGRSFDSVQQGEFVDFSTYDKFASYADRTIDLVFDEGKMPDAKVTFENFWSEKDGVVAAQLLGNHFLIDATLRRPGRPIADAGPSRKAPLGPVDLTGTASAFATTFAWSFASGGKPAGSAATLNGAGTARPQLTTDIPGAYRIQLVVSDGTTQSEPSFTTITSFVGLDDTSFARDVAPIFANDCRSCHSVGLTTSIEGIPALFDDPATLYDTVRPYINFDDLTSSLVLTKPTGQQHGAGPLPRPGFDLSGGTANKTNYDTFLQWIAEGADDN